MLALMLNMSSKSLRVFLRPKKVKDEKDFSGQKLTVTDSLKQIQVAVGMSVNML